MNKEIAIVLAVDKMGGIGHFSNGIYTIPWKIDVDMKHFASITTGHTVIMGKNTYLSMGSPLKNRVNIVVSTSLTSFFTDRDNLIIVPTLSEALKLSENKDKVYIIGGVQLYIEAERMVPNLRYYTTYIDHDFGCNIKIPADLHIFGGIKTPFFDVLEEISDQTVSIHFHHPDIQTDNKIEKCYLKILLDFVNWGPARPKPQALDRSETTSFIEERMTRNGIVYSTFNKQLTHDLSSGFPIFTTKKVNIKAIFEELIFFLRGQTDTKILEQKGIVVWKENTSRFFLDSIGKTDYLEGEMGPMYGKQLRDFNSFDQLDYVINLIKNDPLSRRICMTTFNPAQASEGVLYPCHGVFIQFYVSSGRLHCTMTQRSADWFLGVVWNVASYALLVHLICSLEGVNLSPGTLTINFGDTHLYKVHRFSAIRQLARAPRSLPTLSIKQKRSNITDFEATDIILKDYDPYPFIKAPMIA